MEEVQGFLGGELDYSQLRGGTGASQSCSAARLLRSLFAGPLVYPAGFVHVYSALRWLTGGDVAAAQPLFALLYVCTLAVVLRVYASARVLPPALLPLLCLSKRLHSIYVLRLFNDGVAMLPAFALVALVQDRRWRVSPRTARPRLTGCAQAGCRARLEPGRVGEDERAALCSRPGARNARELPHAHHRRRRRTGSGRAGASETDCPLPSAHSADAHRSLFSARPSLRLTRAPISVAPSISAASSSTAGL